MRITQQKTTSKNRIPAAPDKKPHHPLPGESPKRFDLKMEKDGGSGIPLPTVFTWNEVT